MSNTSAIGDVKIIQNDGDARITVHGDWAVLQRYAEERYFPPRTAFRLGSGAYHKYSEWDRILKEHTPDLFLLGALVAVEDSEEHERNPVDIARGKNEIIARDLGNLSQAEDEEMLRKMGVKDHRYTLDVTEDRFCEFDPRLKEHPVWDKFRNLPLIRECFEDGAEWPSYRFKELTDEMGGIPEFLMALEEAYNDLSKKYDDLTLVHKVGIAVHFKPAVPGKFPLPDDGVVVQVLERGATLKFPTKADYERLKKEGLYSEIDFGMFQYAPDNLDTPVYDRFKDMDDPYYDYQFGAARAWLAFADVVDVPKRAVPRRLNETIKYPDPILLSTRSKLPKGTRKALENPVFIQKTGPRLNSLADLERDAVPTYGMFLRNVKKVKKDDLENLIRRVEIMLRFTEAVTQKSLHNQYYVGEPLLVQSGLKKDLQPMLNSLVSSKAMGVKPSMIFDWIKASSDVGLAEELDEKLQWDPRTFTPPDQHTAPVSHQLMSQSQLRLLTGMPADRLNVAMIGSASLSVSEAAQGMRRIANHAARNGMNIHNGGGTRERTIMGAGLYGAVDAFQAGYSDFHIMGQRVPIASLKEGSEKPFVEYMRSLGHDITAGGLNEEYMQIADRFHFRTWHYMAERQHPIMGGGDVTVQGIGGIGTSYESLCVVLSNLYYLRDIRNGVTEPKSFFPGFEAKLRPIELLDTDEFHRFLRKTFTEDELMLMCASFHEEDRGVVDRLDQYATKGVDETWQPERMLAA